MATWKAFPTAFAVVIWQISVWPCVKDHAALCACAKCQNHASPERCRKSFPIIFLGDHSNFGNLTAFRAIFSHIFTAHVQERPLMNFRLKF